MSQPFAPDLAASWERSERLLATIEDGLRPMPPEAKRSAFEKQECERLRALAIQVHHLRIAVNVHHQQQLRKRLG